MEQYAFLNYSEYDRNYYDTLYDTCRQGGQVEGKTAVDFFKRSNVPPAILRDIWNLAGVHKQKFLAKDEFNLYLKYLALAQLGIQSISIESLKNNQSRLEGPTFQGIELPLKRQISHNPFDDFENDDDGFETFQVATPTASFISGGSLENGSKPLPPQQVPIQPQTTFTNAPSFQNKFEDLLSLNFTMGHNPMASQNQQPLPEKQLPLMDLIDISGGSKDSLAIEESNTVKTFEDIMNEKLKHVKFQPQVKVVEPNPSTEQSWSTFTVPQLNDPAKPKDRYDLINDAFAELLDSPPVQQVAPEKKDVTVIDQEDSEGSFGEFEEAKQDDLLNLDDSPSLPQVSQQPSVNLLGGLESLNFNGNALFPPPLSGSILMQPQQVIKHSQSEQADPSEIEDDGEFEEYQDAGHVSSIKEVNEMSRQDSNIFSNSKNDIENSFENNASQELGGIEFKQGASAFQPDTNWLTSFGQSQGFDQQKQEQPEDLEDDYGDWTEGAGSIVEPSADLSQPKVIEEGQNDSSGKEQTVNILELDEDTSSHVVEIVEKVPSPKYQKPKVALNENNLLSGFMMEFGLTTVSNAKSLLSNQHIQPAPSNLLSDVDFGIEVSTQQQVRNEQRENSHHFQSRIELKQELQKQLDTFFNSSKDDQDKDEYSDLTEEVFVKEFLQSKEKLNRLGSYLKSVVEVPSELVEETVGKQKERLDEIDRMNKEKTEAAINEEFEIAAAFKKKITAAQSNFLAFKEIGSLLALKPQLSLRDLIELCIEVDSKLHFSRSLVKQMNQSTSKSEVAFMLILFLKQIALGPEKVKTQSESFLQAISKEINQAESILGSLFELEESDLSAVAATSKIQRFIKGLRVIQKILQAFYECLRIAEMQEDDTYSMDFEAQIQEATQSKAKLDSLLEQYRSLSREIREIVGPNSTPEFNTLADLNEILGDLKSEEKRDRLVSEKVCGLCCLPFFSKGLENCIQHNGVQYHPFCINFQLNRVANQ